MGNELKYQRAIYEALDKARGEAEKPAPCATAESFAIFVNAITLGGEYPLQGIVTGDINGWSCIIAACNGVNNIGILISERQYDHLKKQQKQKEFASFDSISMIVHDNPIVEDGISIARLLINDGDAVSITPPVIMLQGGGSDVDLVAAMDCLKGEFDASITSRTVTRE